MPKKKIPIAIAYDFDGTLSPGNMQEHSFIPELGISKKKFWEKTKIIAKENDMDEILAYMWMMIEEARSKVPIKKETFKMHGRAIKFFKGVDGWFKRINEYAESKGVFLKHFIISSGLREMIRGSSLAKQFDHIFASGFMYDKNDVAIWPAVAVNYTAKTQYLFRINKWIMNSYDNSKINKYTPEAERPFPFTNMVYIGDGETDIPCMKMIKHQKGYAVAVYKPKTKGTKQSAMKLLEQGRADYVASADYSQGKGLDKILKLIIDRITAEFFLKQESFNNIENKML